MAHTEQLQFIQGVRWRFPASFRKARVLEIGSYNVNGTVRDLFDDPQVYIGLDLAPGRDVDVVCHGADYFCDEQFDTIISTECFEHDARWAETFANMHRLCKHGGLCLFTCASNQRHEHGTRRTSPADTALATDYYRNLNVKDFEDTFALVQGFSWYAFEARENDLYWWGVKR